LTRKLGVAEKEAKTNRELYENGQKELEALKAPDRHTDSLQSDESPKNDQRVTSEEMKATISQLENKVNTLELDCEDQKTQLGNLRDELFKEQAKVADLNQANAELENKLTATVDSHKKDVSLAKITLPSLYITCEC
jgi:hypothetical protein